MVRTKRNDTLKRCKNCGKGLYSHNESGFCHQCYIKIWYRNKKANKLVHHFCRKCGKKIYGNNPTGYCQWCYADVKYKLCGNNSKYSQWNFNSKSKITCRCKECGRLIRSHNKSGYCYAHRNLGWILKGGGK